MRFLTPGCLPRRRLTVLHSLDRPWQRSHTSLVSWPRDGRMHLGGWMSGLLELISEPHLPTLHGPFCSFRRLSYAWPRVNRTADADASRSRMKRTWMEPTSLTGRCTYRMGDRLRERVGPSGGFPCNGSREPVRLPTEGVGMWRFCPHAWWEGVRCTPLSLCLCARKIIASLECGWRRQRGPPKDYYF